MLKSSEASPARSQAHHFCVTCRKSFSSRHHLVRHERSVHERTLSHACHLCRKMFCRKDVLNKHIKTHYRPFPDFTAWQQHQTEPASDDVNTHNEIHQESQSND